MPSSRPLLHFTCHDGWINDPLGLTWHDGTYHLFFQYVPGTDQWAPECRWGHCTSATLTGWQEQRVALGPGEGDSGVWSGSLVTDDDGQARIFYTSVTTPDYAVGRVRTATPQDPHWESWRKGDVVVTAPEDTAPTSFRDPFVFRDQNRWWMLVGTALPDEAGAASCFSSDDLVHWTHEGLAASRSTAEHQGAWSGSLWECPQLVKLESRHFLITAVWEDDRLHHVAYAQGIWKDGKFTAQSWHQLTYGSSYYAPSLFTDKDGRPGLIFWLRNAAGTDWTGALSIPYLLEVHDGQLQLVPHPDIAAADANGDPNHVRVLEWNPTQGDLLIHDQGAIRLTHDDAGIVVQVDGEPDVMIPMHTEHATVIVDGPICEIVLGSALYAVGSQQDLQVELE